MSAFHGEVPLSHVWPFPKAVAVQNRQQSQRDRIGQRIFGEFRVTPFMVRQASAVINLLDGPVVIVLVLLKFHDPAVCFDKAATSTNKSEVTTPQE